MESINKSNTHQKPTFINFYAIKYLMGKFKDKYYSAPPAFNFEDVMLLPGLAKTEPKNIDITSKFSKGIKLKVPLISSPMDSVTESSMAVAIAREGGIGVIHRNCSLEEELAMVKAVKRAESFIIRDVVTIGKAAKVSEADELMQKHGISGLPVVDSGKLIGIITGRDVRSNEPDSRVEEAMTKDVISASEGITEAEAISLLKQHRIEKLPVVDSKGNLKGLITYKDVTLRDTYKNALRDEEGRLRVAAAVSPFDLERAKTLSKYADALVIDVAHFHNNAVIDATKKIIDATGAEVIIGNLGTIDGVKESIDRLGEGVAGLRMGIGSGSICITSDVTKAGSPTLFAVSQAADALEEIGMKIPIIADGGIRSAGDVALAFAFGASAAMLGYGFAGCDESPAPKISLDGKYYKIHRGMGSAAAKAKRAAVDRYADSGGKNVDEGIEILVPYRGSVSEVVNWYVAGIRAAMGYAGVSNIPEMASAKVAQHHEKPKDVIKKL